MPTACSLFCSIRPPGHNSPSGTICKTVGHVNVGHQHCAHAMRFVCSSGRGVTEPLACEPQLWQALRSHCSSDCACGFISYPLCFRSPCSEDCFHPHGATVDQGASLQHCAVPGVSVSSLGEASSIVFQFDCLLVSFRAPDVAVHHKPSLPVLHKT